MGKPTIVAFGKRYTPDIRSIRNSAFTAEQQIDEDRDSSSQSCPTVTYPV